MTNTTKHTQGPWKTNVYLANGLVHHTVECSIQQGADNRIIADVYPARPDNDECLSNTRLIAAAPELLEALKELLSWANIKASTNPQTVALNNKVEQAIAKAEGKE